MAKNKSTGLPPARSLDELVEFFDTHDMGEHWEHMPEAHFDIDIKKRTHLVAIDEELLNKLAAIAQSQHVSTEILIHAWLKEKMLEVGS
jgi:CopG antitoxin of type II toxin-antitoxin system